MSRTATPALWSLLEHGATASLTVRSVHSNTCPVDGWLSLSAGQRAGDRDTGSDTRPPCRAAARAGRGRRRTGLGHLPPHRGGQGLRRPHRPARRRADPRRGLRAGGRPRGGPGRGDLRRQGHRLRAVRRPHAARDPVGLPGDAGGRRRGARPGRGGPAATRCARPTSPGGAGPGRRRPHRAGAGRRAERNADVLVASLSDAGASERLRLAALRGPGRRRRHPGVDLDPAGRAGPAVRPHRHDPGTRAGLPDPAAVGGNPLRALPADGTSGGAADRLQQPRRLRPGLATRCTAWSRRSSTRWVLVQILIYAFVAVVWRRRLGLGGHPAAAAAAGPAGGDHRRHRARVDVPGQPAAVVALPQPDAGGRRRRSRCS